MAHFGIAEHICRKQVNLGHAQSRFATNPERESRFGGGAHIQLQYRQRLAKEGVLLLAHVEMVPT